MTFSKDNSYKIINSYQLSPQQLDELHKKYGRPGEMAPGLPAKKKRNRLDAALAAMDRRNKDIITVTEEMEAEPEIINFSVHKKDEPEI